MREDDCYQLGEVIKTHGLKGEVSVRLDVDYPEEYSELESVFLQKEGKLIPFFIESFHLQASNALVKFEDVDTINQAKTLVKALLFLPLSNLPELEEDSYYFHDLIDCMVCEDEKELGLVKSVHDLSGNQLLEVEMKGGKEVLIPMSDQVMLKVDKEGRKIHVSLPDGLLDI